MKTYTWVLTIGLLLVTGLYVHSQPMDQTKLVQLPYAAQAGRACIYQPGGWTIVNCSAAAASSAALNKWSRYIVQCTKDAYFAPGSAATGQDADANDGYLPEGAWADFFTTDQIIYYSCNAAAGSGTCRHIECR